jgi:hypothetical protein
MPVRQSCNGSEWVVRARYDSQTCTYRVSEMYYSHTWSVLSTDDPHAARTIKKTSNFRTVGERRASGLHESLAPQERHTFKHHKHTTSTTGWLRPINLRRACVQKHARRDVRLALNRSDLLMYEKHFHIKKTFSFCSWLVLDVRDLYNRSVVFFKDKFRFILWGLWKQKSSLFGQYF